MTDQTDSLLAGAPSGEALRDLAAAELLAARDRTTLLTSAVDEADLVKQHSPLMSPLVWDLAHIANQEELWLLRAVGGRDAMRPEIVQELDALLLNLEAVHADRQLRDSRGDECADFFRVFPAGGEFDPAGDIDPPRMQVGDGRAHIVRSETTGDDEPAGVGHPLGQPPVERLAGTGARSVDQKEAGPVEVEAGDVRMASGKGLDDTAHSLSDEPGVVGSLHAVQLHGVEPDAIGDLHHSPGGLVAEDAHRHGLVRQPLHDVLHRPGGHLARRGCEHEAHRVGTHAYGQEGVRL